jgi:DNA-dependent RNA polymerase auxiliary subunit epsilon
MKKDNQAQKTQDFHPRFESTQGFYVPVEESTKDRVPLNPFLSQATTKVKLEFFTSNKGNTNFSIQPHHELVVLEHL